MKESYSISGALFVLTAIFQTVSANPAGPNVTVGSASITQDGDILSVVTGSNKTVIDWDSFSIGANELTQILQPGANAATLNRVVGTMPSELLGSLVSNGKVALINEHGILVGSTGVIDTHGFIGSTLNTSNEAFIASGDLMFSGASEASIVNKGAILAREGDVFLLGRNVTNAGSIEAQNGNVGLAAGGEIVLRKASDENVYVQVKSSSRGDKVVNSGTIRAIQADLRQQGGNPYQYAMNTGEAGAPSGTTVQFRQGGGVYLNAGPEGSVVHSGQIQATKGVKGGEVALSGRTVDVKSGSTIDASGPKGGGKVKIGGGYQGKDASIANSKATRVEKDAVIKADATESGKGGQVVVWSDGATSYQGSISAKGTGAGAGGDAEVSGKEHLDFRGTADLSSESGVKGSLLLDPANISIVATNPDIDGDGTSGDDLATAGDLDDANLDFAGQDSYITAGQIATINLVSNLTLAATNNITVDTDLNVLSIFTLDLNAGNDIILNSGISNTLTGALTLTAGNDIVASAPISVIGALTLNAGGDINVTDSILSVGSIALNFGQSGSGGTLSFGAGGTVSGLLGSVTATGGAGDDAVTFASTPAGAIAIDLAAGTNSVTLTTGDDTVGVIGANAIQFGSASIANVATVDAGTGTNEVVLSAGDDTFEVSGANAGTTSGIGFTSIQSVDGNGGNDLFINGTASVFDGATNSVEGIAAVDFDTVQTTELDLTTGDDLFVVTGVGSGTFDGQGFSGLATVNGLGGANEVQLTGGNDAFEITGVNAGTGAGIAFTGLGKVDGSGGSDTLTNALATAYDGSTHSVGNVEIAGFETVDTQALDLTAGDDLFVVTGANAGTFDSVNFTGLSTVNGLGGTNEVRLTAADDTFDITGTNAGTGYGISFTSLSKVDALGAPFSADTLNNLTTEAFNLETASVAGVTIAGFGTIDTSAVLLGSGNNAVSLIGGGSVISFTGLLNLTGVTSIDGQGGFDDVFNNTGMVYEGATNTLDGITLLNFEQVATPFLSLTAGDDVLTTGIGGDHSFNGINFVGLIGVDGLGGSDTYVNTTGSAFSAETLSASGPVLSNFETIQTARLNLTSGDDAFNLTGSGTGTFGGLNYTGLTEVNGLAGTNSVVLTAGNDSFTVTGSRAGSGSGVAFTDLDAVDGAGGSNTLINSTASAYDGATNSVSGVAQTNFQTVNTALLNLTTGDDIFTVTGAGAGTFGAVNFTGLTGVDALAGTDTLVNNSGTAFQIGTTSVAGVGISNFETVNTALLALTAGADTFTVTGANAGTIAGLNFTGVTDVDGLGGSDLLVNATGLAFDGATTSVGGVTISNFETVSTALLNLTTGDDLFEALAANSGSFGGLAFTNLTQVDGLGGLDLFTNSTGLAFEASTLSVAGISAVNFETVNTALLNLTAGNDLFALTGAGTGSFGGISYTGLVSVDGLGGLNTVELTAGDDSFEVTGARAGTGEGVGFVNLDAVDGAGGSDTLVNSTVLAYDGATNSVSGVSQTNFETIDTALLNLTAGDDLFTVTGGNAGTFGALNFINLTQVDGLSGSDTLVNATALAYDGATNTVSGVAQLNFETINTALLTLTTGDDLFTVTGANAGVFGALNFTGLSQVDALAGSDSILLTAGNDALTVTGSGAITTSGVGFSAIEAVDGAGGSNAVTLTAGDDVFTATGTRSGSSLGIAFTNIDSVDGAGGTNTYVGTAGSDLWAVTGTNAGTLLGTSFSGFSQLRSGGTAIDTFGFASGGDVTGFISGTDAANGGLAALAFTNSGAATSLSGSVRASGLRLSSTSGGSFVLTNAANDVPVIAANLDGGLSFSNGGSYTVGTVDGTTGITTTGDNVSLNGAAGEITLAADVSTGSGAAGAVVFDRDVELATNVSLTGGSITFSGDVDGAFGLTANSSGETAFIGAVGSGTALASLTTDAGGQTAFTGGGAVTTGAQSYGDAVLLQGGGAKTFTGSTVTFSGTLDGASATTVNATSTVFGGAVGSGTALASLTTDAAGTTQINGGSITTTGTQSFNDSVTLGAASTLLAGSGVTFAGTVDGASALTVNATGSTTFGGAVGSGTALTSLITDAAGTTTIGGPSVATTGGQSYGDDVVLTGGTTLFSGTSVAFGAKLDGGSVVTVNATDTYFIGAVGSNASLASLTTDAAGTTRINGGLVSTSGSQIFGDAVILGQDTNLSAGGLLDFASISAGGNDLTLDVTGTTSLGTILGSDVLRLLTDSDVTQKTGTHIEANQLTGITLGKTVLFNNDNQIVTLGNLTAAQDFLLFDKGAETGGSIGMTVTGNVSASGSLWLVEGSGGLQVNPTASVTVSGPNSVMLLVGGLDLALGVPGAGELVLKGDIDLTNGARGIMVMNSIGLNGGSDLSGAKHLIKSLNFAFDPTLPLVFGDALRGQAQTGTIDYNVLTSVIASKLSNPILGPLTAAVFQSPKPDTDSASQISDIMALLGGFFNDLENADQVVANDADAIVEIGKMARFESGVFPPAYGPFALTSYEYEWWLQEKEGRVKEEDLFYGKRYPLYLKQKGTGPNGRPDYDSILEDR